MDNDPHDPDYRELVWQALRWEFASLGILPHSDYHAFDAWKERAIDAEIERRRRAMIQRANVGRLARGEPLIDPFDP
jgi:hypothetical protein